MGEALDKINNFVTGAERVGRESLQTSLTMLYRAEGETFLIPNAAYVDTGKVDTRTSTQGLWTDGAAGGCTALAVVNAGKIVLAHVVSDCETNAERQLLATMIRPTQIAMAMPLGFYMQAFKSERSARESSLYGAIRALEGAFSSSMSVQELAALTTIMTGFAGRDWTHECVLAAHTINGIGFFMGANELEELHQSERWRIRRNSFNGPPKPVKAMPGLRLKQRKIDDKK